MKIKVAVVFGGRSTEHEISIISAVQAMHAIDRDRYDVVPVYMSKEGDFFTGDALADIAAFQGKLSDVSAKSEQVDWIRDHGRLLLVRHNRKRFGDNTLAAIDVALPVVHGTNTEDGTLTGFLATLGVPVAGCDVLSSAVGMNKYVMKAVLKDNGIPVLPCVCFSWKDYDDPEGICRRVEERFSYPVIVKPVNLGSSIGISKADNREQLEEAVELAFTFAKQILAEPAITDLKEVNCAVLGDYEEALASECESPLGSDEILSFQDKYMSGAKNGAKAAGTKTAGAKAASGTKGSGMASLQRRLPADIPPEKREEIRTLAVRAFQCLNCSGVSRIDFMLDRADGDRVYLNEINTIPGSLSFYLWEPVGTDYTTLLNRIIELALKQDRENRKLVYSFDTNVLAGVRL